MFTTLLGQAGNLDGVLVTADALHVKREHAAWLHGHGAHCLVTVKGNQPGLLRQLKSLPGKTSRKGTSRTAAPTAGSRNASSRSS